MANLEENQEHGWIEKVKSEGSVPLLEPDHCPNGWASPSGDVFKVRGPGYLTTKAKIPGGDWLKGPMKISEILNNTKIRLRRALDDEISKDRKKPFVWAFNLQVPSKENYSVVVYFVDMEPIPKGSLMDRFLKGDDGLRNSRLKLIANIVEGPRIVRKAIGEQAICIIG